MRGRENGRMDAVDANFESMSTAVRRESRRTLLFGKCTVGRTSHPFFKKKARIRGGSRLRGVYEARTSYSEGYWTHTQ